jgi:broad specificity phosphatase PhoE
MGKFFVLLIAIISLASCSHTYYIVRHGEKELPAAGMSNDVPLSEKGKQRAEALKEILKDKNIKAVYSTKTLQSQRQIISS